MGASEVALGRDLLLGQLASSFHLIQLALHGGQLVRHNVALSSGVTGSDKNCGNTNSGSKPETQSARNLPKAIPFFSGVFLMGFAIVFLIYCFNREDYFMYIGAFGGAVPFIIGAILIMF